jgi:hypothetical protein
MAKSKPIGVRFDLDKLDMIQKEQNLTSMQSVLDYLMDFYLAHSQSDKIIAELDKIKRGVPSKNMPPCNTNGSNLVVSSKLEQIPVENQKKPPEGLKGIDLAIWKSENWK